MQRVAGTCVAIDGHGVLLRGPSAAGKSDLALRLIDAGAALVADDFTELTASDGRLLASAPKAIRGLLEVRGLGILRFAASSPTPLAVVVDLVRGPEVARMPDADCVRLLDVAVPLFRVEPFEASAAAKVRLAVRLATGSIMAVQ